MARKYLTLGPAFLLGLLLAACDGGGGLVATTTADERNLSPVETASLTDDDLIHFLKRTHFGFNPTDLEKLKQMGFDAYLEWMLDLKPNYALEQDAKAATVQDPDFPNLNELAQWAQYLQIHNPNAFQEVLAMFWHNHFATAADVLGAQERYWFFDHMNLWRHFGTSTLPDLLHRMATDWSMLVWLDGIFSTRGRPNENFAREFWELFTLGADNGYTEFDIQEASRAFTGYRRVLLPDAAGPGRDQLVITWDPNRHDNTAKTILGVNFPGAGQAEYQNMVSLTLNRRPVAEFITRKIWEAFAFTEPSELLINELATKFRMEGYQLKVLFRTMFRSHAFFSDRAKVGMIKSPVEHHIGFIRATGLKLTPVRLDNALRNAAQRPTLPPTVNGWPAGSFWLSSQGMVERANFLRDCVYYRNELPQQGYDVSVLIDPALTADHEVVDQLAWRLQVKLNEAQRDACIAYLNQDRNAGGNFDSPWDAGDPDQTEMKLRGLLYILAQHPDHHLR
jgi:hypothetical protein